MSYGTLPSQQTMFFDDRRNRLYEDALAAHIEPGMVVMDLGAGLGIHGLMAARLGARRVYLVEPSRILAMTRQLVAANGLDDVVTCIEGSIEQVEIPEPCDVIVSVFTGNFLLMEDLLPSLFYARDACLAPGGVLLPDAAEMIVAPVDATRLYTKHIERWRERYHELDLSVVRPFAANQLYSLPASEHEARSLGPPVVLKSFDFMSATEASVDETVQLEISEDGTCHGILGWFRANLGEGVLKTGPDDAAMHWSQVFLPLSTPRSVRAGEKLSFHLNRPAFGEWSWALDGVRQSTFLSEPRTPASLQRRSGTFAGRRNRRGDALFEVLDKLRGECTIDAIVSHVCDVYPTEFPRERIARNFVNWVVQHYCE